MVSDRNTKHKYSNQIVRSHMNRSLSTICLTLVEQNNNAMCYCMCFLCSDSDALSMKFLKCSIGYIFPEMAICRKI